MKNTDSARTDETCGCGKHVALIQKSEVKLHTGLNALRTMLQHLYDNHKFSLGPFLFSFFHSFRKVHVSTLIHGCV